LRVVKYIDVTDLLLRDEAAIRTNNLSYYVYSCLTWRYRLLLLYLLILLIWKNLLLKIRSWLVGVLERWLICDSVATNEHGILELTQRWRVNHLLLVHHVLHTSILWLHHIWHLLHPRVLILSNFNFTVSKWASSLIRTRFTLLIKFTLHCSVVAIRTSLVAARLSLIGIILLVASSKSILSRPLIRNLSLRCILSICRIKGIIQRAQFYIAMCKMTPVPHLAIAMLLKVTTTRSFILKVYISIRISIRNIVLILLHVHLYFVVGGI